MDQFEDLISTHAANARYDLGQALTPVCSLDDEGKLGDHDLGRIADRYHLMTWWQEVTDLTHGIEETIDGGTALLTVRQRAQRYLIEVGVRAYGSTFAFAMAESRRSAAQAFLDATRQIADALAPLPARDARLAETRLPTPTPAEPAAAAVAVEGYRP